MKTLKDVSYSLSNRETDINNGRAYLLSPASPLFSHPLRREKEKNEKGRNKVFFKCSFSLARPFFPRRTSLCVNLFSPLFFPAPSTQQQQQIPPVPSPRHLIKLETPRIQQRAGLLSARESPCKKEKKRKENQIKKTKKRKEETRGSSGDTEGAKKSVLKNAFLYIFGK